MILPTCPGRGTPCRLLAAGLLLLALAGCASPQLRELEQHPPQGLAQRAEVRGVPFFAQEKYQCGPATLAMVLNAGGAAVTPGELVAQVWLPERHGSLQPEMLATARRHGFLALTLAPRLADLLAELDAGHPVIVLENRGLDWFPIWHYAVAIGYDLGRDEIVLRSGNQPRETLSLSTFERLWARSGHWAMLALPVGTLPAGTDPTPYLDAAMGLERAGRVPEARTAYVAAVARWPDSATAFIGLGNTAYAEGDLVAAEQEYRRAIALEPRSVAALNNLAQTLHDRGSRAEALEFARRAARIQGPLQPAAQRTLDSIAATR